jgi:hypothetical protein
MRKNNWGEDRVMYYNAQSRLCSMLVSWTSLALQDAFALASAGSSWFRVDDLLNLAALLQDASDEGDGGWLRCKPNCAADVKCLPGTVTFSSRLGLTCFYVGRCVAGSLQVSAESSPRYHSIKY